MKMRFAWLLLLAAATALAAEKTAAPAKAMDISEIDPNFKTAEVGGKPVQYVDVLKGGGPFRISGFPWRKADGSCLSHLRRTDFFPDRLHIHRLAGGSQ